MAAQPISIEIRDAEVTRALVLLAANGRSLRPTFNRLGRRLLTRVQLGFRNSQDPFGKPWTPKKRVVKKRSKPLIDSGRLLRSLSYRATNDSVELGTNLPYAAIHNFGGEIEHRARSTQTHFRVNAKTGQSRFARKSRANLMQWTTRGEHKQVIPQRMFLPYERLPDSWAAAVLEEIAKGLGEGLSR